MHKKMGVLAIIPARGGSKSIPLKNISLFCGKPLISYSIKTALACPSIDRVIVSTDSEKIASVAMEYGAEVPFMRPAELAEDNTMDWPVFHHCIRWIMDNETASPEIIVQLRPTSPLRTEEMVEEAIRLLKRHPEADSVRAGCAPTQNPFKMWTIGDDGFLNPLVDSGIHEQWNQPRQKLPKVFWQNGYVDVAWTKTIMEKRSMTGHRIIPLVVEGNETIDIDDDLTLRFAETLYKVKFGVK